LQNQTLPQFILSSGNTINTVMNYYIIVILTVQKINIPTCSPPAACLLFQFP